MRELEEVRQKKMKDEENAGKVKDPKKTDEAEKIKELRLERAAAMCEEAADTLIRIERQFDAIERRYNKLIEQKTIFASQGGCENTVRSSGRSRRRPYGCACRSVE